MVKLFIHLIGIRFSQMLILQSLELVYFHCYNSPQVAITCNYRNMCQSIYNTQSFKYQTINYCCSVKVFSRQRFKMAVYLIPV